MLWIRANLTNSKPWRTKSPSSRTKFLKRTSIFQSWLKKTMKSSLSKKVWNKRIKSCRSNSKNLWMICNYLSPELKIEVLPITLLSRNSTLFSLLRLHPKIINASAVFVESLLLQVLLQRAQIALLISRRSRFWINKKIVRSWSQSNLKKLKRW